MKETAPLGHVWTWTHDRFGNVLEATDARNQKTQLVWAHGHQLQSRTVRNANGSVYRTETTTRNLLGQPTRVEARDGSGTLIAAQDTAFDAAHRVARLTDIRPGAYDKTRAYDWSPGGLLDTMEDQTPSASSSASRPPTTTTSSSPLMPAEGSPKGGTSRSLVPGAKLLLSFEVIGKIRRGLERAETEGVVSQKQAEDRLGKWLIKS